MLYRAVSTYQNVCKISHTISGYRNTPKSRFENFYDFLKVCESLIKECIYLALQIKHLFAYLFKC